MKDLLFVTGGTGLGGSNVALLARENGRAVRTMVRSLDHEKQGLDALRDAGIEVVQGDVTDAGSLDRCMAGATEVIHAAAVLGGSWSETKPEEFWAINYQGALNTVDAAKRAGVRRTIMLETQGIIDPAFTQTERSPVIAPERAGSVYLKAKLSAHHGVMMRAAMGQDICTVTPGAIYGGSPFVERALHPTSFTRTLLRGLTGELPEYVVYPMMWTYVPDLAQICVRALDRGNAGRRYLAMGDDADVSSVVDFCNRGAELAGSPHRVRPVRHDSPEAAKFGTIGRLAERTYAKPLIDCSGTTAELGYAPTPRDEALKLTIAWLRSVGKFRKPGAGQSDAS